MKGELVVDPTEIEQLTATGAEQAYKLAVRNKDGEVYAIAHGPSMVEVLRRAHAIAAAEELIAETHSTVRLLRTVGTVLAQSGRMSASKAMDDRYTQAMRVLHRAKGGAA